MATAGRFVGFLRNSLRSRLGWLLACLHAAWFFLAIANMSPPSPGLAEFLDRGGWSSATVLAGRPFHFHYESIFLKLLFLVDMPSILASLPLGLLLWPLQQISHLGSYERSYVEAALLVLLATYQWLAIGLLVQSWLASQLWGARALQRIDRYFVIGVAVILFFAVITVPIVNETSRRLGFRHGGISFRY